MAEPTQKGLNALPHDVMGLADISHLMPDWSGHIWVAVGTFVFGLFWALPWPEFFRKEREFYLTPPLELVRLRIKRGRLSVEMSSGELRELYFIYTSYLKAFLELKFGFSSLDKTTSELEKAFVKFHEIESEIKKEILTFLKTADDIKYGGRSVDFDQTSALRQKLLKWLELKTEDLTQDLSGQDELVKERALRMGMDREGNLGVF